MEITRWITFVAFFITVFFCDISWSVRLLMLDIPSPIAVGDFIELTCSFEMEGENLYSVKWYKNDVEFYRYVPNDWPPGQTLPMPGVRVDLTRSDEQRVYLKHVDLNSEGKYRCEVSAEAPEFKTVEMEKEMKVYVYPQEGPQISGSHVRYNIGDTVNINCTSTKSKPAATLKWYINDEEAPVTFENQYPLVVDSDGLQTSTRELNFVVTSKHFRGGNMKLRCTATISRGYVMSSHATIHGQTRASPLHVSIKPDKAGSSSSMDPTITSFSIIYSSFIVFILNFIKDYHLIL